MTSLARALERRGRRDSRRLRAMLGTGEARYVAELLPVFQALAHERFADGVFELLLVSRNSAHDPGGAGERECFTCRSRWFPSLAIAGILLVEFLNTDAGLTAGLCPRCWSAPDRSALLAAGLERDLGTPRSAIRAVHPDAVA